MSASLRIHSDPAPMTAHAPNRRDAADAWLDRVTAMLRVPAHERDAIRAELNEHLRERIRDLMLSGAAEGAATSQAISELGDAALLARRYQEAIEPSSRRSLMHVGIATAATAALVFSGAALFQNGSTPTPGPSGNALVAATPSADREAELRTRIEEASRALAESRNIIAQQERELAGRRGEVESMELRLRIAEERAGSLQKESFDVYRQYEAAREDARRAQAELEKAERDRDAAMSRLAAMESAAISTPATPPAMYAPEPNLAQQLLRKLMISNDNADSLGAVIAQPDVAKARVYLRNERLASMTINADNGVTLPNRQLSLGELIDLINTSVGGGGGLAAREMPDGVAIDTIESWDRSDKALVIYDLSDIAAREDAKMRAVRAVGPMFPQPIDQLRQVIIKTVTPDLWQDNGGDLGAIQVLNTSLIVTAPERSHHQIRWIIEQVRAASARAEVPILSDLPLVDLSYAAARNRNADGQAPRKHDYPDTVEGKQPSAGK